ncbi:MAG: translocation/assembly module TamB, partial [Acidobacteriota bacterium]|nr:translocation/assembly module TamB [Acidobacteriota bacterium]
MKKRWVRRTTLVLAAIAALVVLVVCLLHAPPVRQFAFDRLCRRLERTQGVRVEALITDIGYLDGTVDVRDLSVRSVAAPDRPFLRAGRLFIDIGVRDALRGRWTVEDLALERPEVAYLVDAEGRDNLPRGGSAKTSPGRIPDFLVVHAVAEGGAFRYEDLRRDLSATIPSWRLSVAGDARTRTHHVEFAQTPPADPLVAYGVGREAFGVPIQALRLVGVLDLGKGEFTISSARVAASGVAADIAGKVSFDAPSFDVTVRPAIDLGVAAGVAAMNAPLRGDLSGEVAAAGDFDRVDVSAHMTVSGLSVRDWRQESLALALTGGWRRDSGRWVFPEIALSAPDGAVAGKADLAASGAQGGASSPNSVSVEFKRLNLRSVAKLAGAPLDVASRADGRIDMRWQGGGSLGKVAAAAHLDIEAMRVEPGPGVLPVGGALDARLEANRLEIDARGLDGLGVAVTGKVAFRDFREIEGDVSGAGEDIGQAIARFARFFGAAEPPAALDELHGPAQFRIQASGPLAQVEAVAQLDVPNLAFKGRRGLGARSNFIWRGAALGFDGDFGLPQNAAASVRGSLDFSQGEAALSAEARGERLPALLANDLFGLRLPLDGVLDASATLQGPLRDPGALEGKASLRGEGLAIDNEPLGALDAALALSGGVLRSERLILRRAADGGGDGLDDAVEAQLSYALVGADAGRYAVRAQGRGLRLRNPGILPAGSPLPGKVDLEMSGEGTLDEPRLRARVHADEVRVVRAGKEVPLGAVSVEAGLSDGGVSLAASAPRLDLSGTGRIGLSPPFPFSGELQARKSDLGVLDLRLRDGQPLGGALDAVVRATGELGDLQGAEVVADVQGLMLQARDPDTGQERRARLFSPASLRYRDGVLDIPVPALLVMRSSQVELSGGFPLAGTGAGETLRLRGRVNIADALPFVKPQAGPSRSPSEEGLSIDGVLNLDLGVKVRGKVFGGDGELSLERGAVQIPGSPLPFTDIAVNAGVEDGALVVRSATAKWGVGDIALSGEFPFSALPQPVPGLVARDGPVRFNLTVAGLTPEMTGMFPEGLTGRVSLHAEGSAAKADPRALRAEVAFDELRFKVGTLEFRQQAPVRVDVADGVATVSSFTVVGPETDLRLSGSATLFPEGGGAVAAPIGLRLEGHLDAALLTFGDPDLKAAGRLDLLAALDGSLYEPVLSGYAETGNGRLALSDPRIVADDLRIRLGLSPDRITVERLEGILNGGSLRGEGSLGYRRGILNDIDLRATFQDFFLDAPEGLKSASSGTISIKSEEDAIVVGGNVRVTESSYRESIEVGGQVMNYLKSQQVVIPDSAPNPLLGRIRYNIGVRTTTPLLVQNNVARVEAMATNLRIVGTYYEPSVTGRIALTEGGEIILNNREYYIDRGVVTFANQTRVEPELDIQAQTKVAEYEITLQLAGNPDRLTTSFSSEPSLPERDILSLLVTGKTTSETQGQEMQVMQTQALSLLAGQAGEQLTGEARKALHLSTFRIDPGQIASESDPGARLTIGEDVTRDLSLAYSMNLVNGGDQIWVAQYAVTRRLTTQATKQQDNTYRFEFRHDIRFGGGGAEARSASRAKPRPEGAAVGDAPPSGAVAAATPRRGGATKFEIGAIRFTGGSDSPQQALPERALLDRLGAHPGDSYELSKIKNGLYRQNQLYEQEHRQEADIRF